LLAEQVQGKPLSYNNWIDLDAAFQVARDLGPTGVAIIKHTNPCGAAVAPEGLVAAYRAARACDPTSAFGGIVATAGTLDAALAGELTETFLEVIVAAGASDEARALLARKKNLRLLLVPAAVWVERPAAWIPRPVTGGLLVQAPDLAPDDVRSAEVVTQRAPTEEEWRALALAWTVVRHVKSNGIVFARADRTVGIGAGQMSRVDSSRIAVMKAQSSLVGSSLASDAFFPFADGVEAAAAAGATAIVQPGGSIRDPEVIAAADAAGLAMVFTGRRHFRH
jgi:phosphoribosylaminoimidazolecarboxamide formyltransferase/IMP cyclohydrolase